MKIKHVIALAAVVGISSLGLARSASAGTVFLDTFSGATDAGMNAQTFASGATTGFNYWGATSGKYSMDAGYFSVVNKASDVHVSFVPHLDADGDANGSYAIFNGYEDRDGDAYTLSMPGLIAGQTYTFMAELMPLAPNPPYPNNSLIQFRQDGNALGSTYTLNPVPAGQESWISMSRTFVATGNDVLSIWNLGGDSQSGNDFGIDNVMLSSNGVGGASPVPLPASATMGIALGGAALGRRAFRAATRR